MVAPSYQSYTQVGEPYTKGNKSYIKLQHPKTKNIREARWYTEEEYNKQYGIAAGAKPAGNKEGGKILRPLKDVLGFSKGYITIFKGDVESVEDWFKYSPARFHRCFGWHFHSEEPLPQAFPSGITPIQLYWDDVSTDDNTLKSDAAIANHLATLLYDPSPSQHVGSVGERLTLTLTLLKDITIDGGQYGPKHFYIFKDMNENVFSWTTQAKVLTPGRTYDLKGTVKEHVRYKGEAQTALLRCTLLS